MGGSYPTSPLLLLPVLSPSVSIDLNQQSACSSRAPVTPSQIPSPSIHPSFHEFISLSITSPAVSNPSSPSPMYHFCHNFSSKTLSPLSAGSLITPLSSYPSIPHLVIYLPHLSVCLSIYPSLLPSFPISLAPLSPRCVPSITFKTALPNQVVTSWQVPSVCLSVCPPAHPSICLPSHPSSYSHLSVLATIHIFPA